MSTECGRHTCGHPADAHDPEHGCDNTDCPCTGYTPLNPDRVRVRAIQLTPLGRWVTEHVAARVRAEQRGAS